MDATGRLLLACCAPGRATAFPNRPPGALIQGEPAWSQVDWMRLVTAARDQGVAPLVCKRLAAVGMPLPDPAAGLLAAAARRAQLRGLRLAADTVQVHHRLQAAGLPVLVLKGAVESALSWGDPSLRDFSDVDVFVPPAAASTAVSVLRAAGYGVIAAKACRFAGAASLAHSQLRFIAPALAPALAPVAAAPGRAAGDGGMIELHWRLLDRVPLFPVPLELFLGAAPVVHVALGGAAVRTLPPAARVLHLSSHAASHGWSKLKWVVDVAQALHRDPDAATQAVELARAWGILRGYAASCHIAHWLFGVPLPEGLPVSGLARGRARERLMARVMPRLTRPLVGLERRGWRPPRRQIVEDVELLDRWSARLALLGHYALPRIEDIEAVSDAWSLSRIRLDRLTRLLFHGPRTPE